MTVTIRRATLENLDRLIPLFDAYRQFYGQPSELSLALKFLNDRLARNESVVLVAENDDGAAVGFAQLYPAFSSIFAASMYVLSDLLSYLKPGGEVLELDCSNPLLRPLVWLVPYVWNWRLRSPMFQHKGSTNHWDGSGMNSSVWIFAEAE